MNLTEIKTALEDDMRVVGACGSRAAEVMRVFNDGVLLVRLPETDYLPEEEHYLDLRFLSSLEAEKI